MAEHAEESDSVRESVVEKISEKLHGHDSSSSDSEDERKPEESTASAIKAKIWRMFGQEKPVHKVLGVELMQRWARKAKIRR